MIFFLTFISDNNTNSDVEKTKNGGRKAKPKRHMSPRKTYPKTPYCKTCKKDFATLFCLRRHIDIDHHSGQVFRCRACDCKYPRKSQLITHLRTVHCIVYGSDNHDPVNA